MGELGVTNPGHAGGAEEMTVVDVLGLVDELADGTAAGWTPSWGRQSRHIPA